MSLQSTFKTAFQREKQMGTIRTSKTLSIALAAASLVACSSWGFGGRAPEDVKIYSIQVDGRNCPQKNGKYESWCEGKPGLYLPKEKTRLDFSKGQNWPTMSPGDLAKAFQACPKP
jgi:hypothetical protein